MESKQASVTVSRRRELVNSARGFDVLIDGLKVARLQSGGRIEGAVEPGRHDVQIQVGRKLSDAISFEVDAGGRADFLVENSDTFGLGRFVEMDKPQFRLSQLDPGTVPELRNTWSRRGTSLQFVALLFVFLGLANGIINGSLIELAVYLAIAFSFVLAGVVLRTGRFDKPAA